MKVEYARRLGPRRPPDPGVPAFVLGLVFLPSFILTGWGEGVSAHESMQFVDRVIAKPVSAEALLEQLAGLTRSRVSPA